MENETCEFEIWIRSTQETCSPEMPDEVLNRIAQEVERRYGAKLWFAEILGKRWSYRAGVRQDFPVSPLHHITLTPRFGMVAEGWEQIPEKDRFLLLSFLRDYLGREHAQDGACSS